MPRFFIDTSVDEHFCRDDDGLDFKDIEAAKTAALDALPELARERSPGRETHTCFAVVRSAEGETLLRASLSLQVETLVPECTLTKMTGIDVQRA